MATQQQIGNLLSISNAYYHSLWSKDFNNSQLGFPTHYEKKLTCLSRLIQALTFDYNGTYNDDTTTILYELLLRESGTYPGAYPAYDPTVITPGTTIVVVSSQPVPVDPIYWSYLDPATEQPDGGRYIYYNSAWKGFRPVLSIVGPQESGLIFGVDYAVIPSGGIQLLPTGNLPFLYDGMELRASSYIAL